MEDKSNRKSYSLLCDLEDDFDLPVFNNMSDARKTFIISLHILSLLQKRKFASIKPSKFVKVLADFPKNELQ